MDHALYFADPEIGRLDDLVDLARYPIENDGATPSLAMADEARRTLDSVGCCSWPGFLRSRALTQAQAEIASLAPKAVVRTSRSSVYARTDAERQLPTDDPRRVALARRIGHLTRDQIPPDSVIARLYVSPGMKRLIAACCGLDRVYEYADPLAGLIVTVLPPGGELSWHYDTNELVVSLMLDAPACGGRFEYVPGLRRPGDENLDGLRRVLRGEAPNLVRSTTFEPGDLQLFRGRYALHRVTAVEGDRPRHVAVLSYADRPGVIGPVDRTRAVYGRVTEAHLVAESARDRLSSTDGLIL